MLKKLKMDVTSPDTPSSVPGSDLNANGSKSKGKGRSATVEDEDMDVDQERDFAPGGDADYFTEEDDEGRFFGGGLTSEQKEILNIFEGASGEGVDDVSSTLLHMNYCDTNYRTEQAEDLSITAIRRMLLRFERAVNKNQDQRSKYPDDPSKFEFLSYFSSQ